MTERQILSILIIIIFAEESWFLAVLYSLCLGCQKNGSGYFDKIFNKTNITRETQSIPISIWQYGKWITKEIPIELPIKNNKPCYIQSEDKDIFWIALLQSAYAQ